MRVLLLIPVFLVFVIVWVVVRQVLTDTMGQPPGIFMGFVFFVMAMLTLPIVRAIMRFKPSVGDS